MVQSVEMLLDPDGEQAVLSQWTELVAAGLPSQARHTGATNRPHITLAVARELDGQQETAIADAASASLPLPVRLGGLLIFGPGPFILCRLVVPSAALLALQRQVVAAVGPTSAAVPHQDPGSWTAHVTLARRLTADQLAGAVTILSPMADLDLSAGAVRRWDGERKVAWTIAGNSDRTGADEQTDAIGDDHRDGAQQ